MMNEELKFVSLENNVKIAYTDHGKNKKQTLFFIHGLANYLWVWKWNIASLQEHYRCVAIDLPGNGFSSRGDYPYSVEWLANVVESTIKTLNLNEVSLVGHSMGGQIALQVALNKKVSIQKLILCAAAGLEHYTTHDAMLFKSAIVFGNFLNMDESHIQQSINSSFFRSDKIATGMIDDLIKLIQANDRVSYRKMLDLCISSMLDTQVFPRLKEIENSCLILFGENDQLIPNRFLHPYSTKEVGLRAAKELPHAQLIAFKETGHFVHIEQAEKVNEAIIRLMDNKIFD